MADDPEMTVQKYCLSVFYCKIKAEERQQNSKEIFSNKT